MKNLRELKKRIGSINKTREITNAMKIIASIRLRNAHRALYDMRPYSDRLVDMIRKLLTHDIVLEHPLFKDKSEKLNKVLILVFTADRGLCGAYNSNIINHTENYIKSIEDEKDYSIITIGKKGFKHFNSLNYPITKEYSGFRAEVEFQHAQDIGEILLESYIEENVGEVVAIYNRYHSSGKQEVIIERVLPLIEITAEITHEAIEFIYEPSKSVILDNLLPLYINVKAWRLLQESSASEQAARMVAMEAASNNCEDMLDNLTLKYNKARQSAITSELIDVVGTAEALRGDE
jgi:F-type H+-transporting ATPase subunit gamma